MLADASGSKNGTRKGSFGKETSTPGPNVTAPDRGPMRKESTPPRMPPMYPGPTPEIESDRLRMTPENPPAPVPAPVPEERPGPEVIWAWTLQPPPRAKVMARAADFLRCRRVVSRIGG